MKVEVRNVRRRFGDVEALRGVSLTFESGELVAIVGESGCGKTTLLRIVAGLESLDEGEVSFGDEVVAAPGRSLAPEKRGIGFVFQSLALWPHMTVSKNVAYGLRARRVAKAEISERVDEVLRRVGLGGMGHRYPHQLSGGQRQRVSLSRAMVLEPRILLMDEPLSSLDANLRRDTARDIRRIQSELALTTLYVTHDMDEAMTMADRVVVMRDGMVVQTGSPRLVYRQPTEPFVAQFTGEISWLRGLAPKSDGPNDEVALVDDSGRVVARTRSAPAAGWSDGRLTIGVRPETVEFVDTHASLRDARLRLTAVVEDVIPGRRVDDVVLEVAGQTLLGHGHENIAPVGSTVAIDVPVERLCVFPDE